METGTLQELNVKPGDVVECVDSISVCYTNGIQYTIGGEDDDGLTVYQGEQGSAFRIVSRASDTPRPFGELTDAEGWSEWTSASEWDVSKYDVQMECIDGIHRVRTRPRQPVQFDIYAKYGKLYPDAYPKTHRISVTFDGGDPDCASIKMEPLT